MSDETVVPFATPDGLNLVADGAGPPTGALVALLHGGGQTRHAWASIADRLAAERYRVIRYDARGHGDSDWSASGAYSVEDFARDAEAVLRTLGRPAALVGASLGGVSGLLVAAAAPELLSALVLVDIVPRFAERGVERIRAFMSGNPDGFASLDEVTAAVHAYNPNRPTRANPEGLMKNLRTSDDGRLRWHWDPAILDRMPSDEVSRMLTQAAERLPPSLPTLLVWGAASDVVDAEGIEAFRRHAPHAEVASIAEAGHMVAGDRNDAFNAIIVDYLKRVL